MKSSHRNGRLSIALLATVLVLISTTFPVSAPPPPRWRLPTLIETNPEQANFPYVAMDDAGNAIAVWQQGTYPQNIWANRFDVSIGSWGDAQLIEFESPTAGSVRVACDAIGNAFAVWAQVGPDLDTVSIYASRYDVGGDSWELPTLLETDDVSKMAAPHVAMNDAGDAIVTWMERVPWPGDWNIMANRYDSSSASWGVPAAVETLAGYAYYPIVAMDGSGSAIVVWTQTAYPNLILGNIYANRFDIVTGSWGIPRLLETDNVNLAVHHDIDIDVSGNAIAVWSQGSPNNIWYNRYDVVTDSWGLATAIEADPINSAYNPRIAMDDSGNAMVVWRKYPPGASSDSTPQIDVWASYYDTIQGTWGPAENIEPLRGPARVAVVAMNSERAVVLWVQGTGNQADIWSNRFEIGLGPTAGWQTVRKVSQRPGAWYPSIATSANGDAMAVWRQTPSPPAESWLWDILASGFSAPH